MMPQLGSIRIIESPYVPYREQIRFAKKGHYFRRRSKRIAADSQSWRILPKPYFLMGNSVVCHPAMAQILRRQIEGTA